MDFNNPTAFHHLVDLFVAMLTRGITPEVAAWDGKGEAALTTAQEILAG
jgi:hypothetical protein